MDELLRTAKDVRAHRADPTALARPSCATQSFYTLLRRRMRLRGESRAAPARETRVFPQIDPQDPTPIYAQIAACVKLGIATCALHAGERLPSVRRLSELLHVSPATTARAYRELAIAGLVKVVVGSGTFVCEPNPTWREELLRSEARRLIRAMLARAASSGLSVEELRVALRVNGG